MPQLFYAQRNVRCGNVFERCWVFNSGKCTTVAGSSVHVVWACVHARYVCADVGMRMYGFEEEAVEVQLLVHMVQSAGLLCKRW